MVGIGASAGGLKPIQEFFEQISLTREVAFVVVQHLSPDYESMMKDLLKRYTNMTIRVITDGEVIRAHHIYLLPPKRYVEIEEGSFRLYQRGKERLMLPINIFLHSLAKNYQEKAIGIILSGSGTDGSLGIRTVCEYGGITMAQSPDTAQFPGMPESAIQTQRIDFMGKVKDITNQLTNIFKQGSLRDPAKGWHSAQQSFYHIINTIKRKQEIDFYGYKRATLERRIEKRMQIVGVYSLVDYSDYLLKNPEEIETLANEFLIGVTRFFRDKEAFSIIKDKIVPELVRRSVEYQEAPQRETLRLWVSSCSTGEEAYSLAILLHQYCDENNLLCDFKIFATDIDRRAINKAGMGVFRQDIVQDIPADLLETYFKKVGSEYKIRKDIRSHIVFAQHNVLNDPPFINMDFVSSRNMLIYVEEASQDVIIEQFLYALRPQGFLFLGSSESVTNHSGDFQVIDKRWKVFQKKTNNRKYTPNINPFRLSKKAGRPNQEGFEHEHTPRRNNRSSANLLPVSDYNSLIVQHYAPTFIITNQQLSVLYVSPTASRFLSFPSSLSDFHLERVIPKNHWVTFKNGIAHALENNGPYEYQQIPFSQRGSQYQLTLRFVPHWSEETEEKVVFVEFVEETEAPPEATAEVFSADKHTQERIKALDIELSETKRLLRRASQQYNSTEEELQSTNEELMSSNEEMQSTNEELQSLNEELYTVNAELQTKISELSQLNNDVNNLLVSTDIGTIFLDHHLNIRKFTPSIQDYFHVRESDLGRPITHFNNNFGLDNFQDNIRRVMDSLRTEQHEVSSETGHRYLMRINPFITHQEEVKGVVISFIDIEELKQKEEELHESTHFAQSIATAIPHLLYVYDLVQKKNVYANRWLPDILGYSEEDVKKIGDINNVVHPEDESRVAEHAQRLLRAEDEETLEIEYRIRKKDGRYLWLFSTEKVFRRNEAGEVVQAIGIAQNITLRKDVEGALRTTNQNLRVANQQLDSFVYTAAHDLQAPVSNLKNLLKLQEKVKDQDKQQNIRVQVASSADRLEDTLQGLISIIDIRKSGRQEVEMLSFDKVLEHVTAALSTVVQDSGATFEANFSEVPKIIYEKPYLHSIMLNLISNAVKYASSEQLPRVKLSTRQEDDCVVLTVQDNGIGINLKEHQEVLFQPFERLDASKPGKGIGLSIIKNMVEHNDGRIEVESEPGEGATFHVYLKCYPGNE